MGNRSYLMIDRGDGFSQLLESNNVLPLLWLAMVEPAELGGATSTSGPSLRLMEGQVAGITIEARAAAERMARRRDGVHHWLGPAAAEVLDQLAAFVSAQGARQFHLDLSEWFDFANSPQEAIDELRGIVQALDTPRPSRLGAWKRRPGAVKRLVDAYGLGGIDESAPAFGSLLAGTSFTVREPWRRDPPRERRSADDTLSWVHDFERLFLSHDGGVVVSALANQDNVQTPPVWSRDDGAVRAMEIDASIGYLWTYALSGNGRVRFGGYHQHPGAVFTAFRCEAGALEVLPVEASRYAAITACSHDGSVAVGYSMANAARGLESQRAYLWRRATGATSISPADARSDATRLSSDGRHAAGSCLDGDAFRAFVWSAPGGTKDIGAWFFVLEWAALGPDGRCGVLRTMSERGAPYEYHFWRDAQELRRIESESGRPLSWARVSEAADAVLGFADGDDPQEATATLWRPDAPVRSVGLARQGGGKLEPLCAGSGGRWFAATVRHPETRASTHVVVWSEQDGPAVLGSGRRQRARRRRPLPLQRELDTAGACRCRQPSRPDTPTLRLVAPRRARILPRPARMSDEAVANLTDPHALWAASVIAPSRSVTRRPTARAARLVSLVALLGALACSHAFAGTLLRIAAFNPLDDSTEQLVAKVGDRVVRIEALSSSGGAGIRLVDLERRRVRYLGVAGQVLFEGPLEEAAAPAARASIGRPAAEPPAAPSGRPAELLEVKAGDVVCGLALITPQRIAAVDDSLSTVSALPVQAAGAAPAGAERACRQVAADGMAQLKARGTLLRYLPPAAASRAAALFDVLEVRPEQRFEPETFFGLREAPPGEPAGARSPADEGLR